MYATQKSLIDALQLYHQCRQESSRCCRQAIKETPPPRRVSPGRAAKTNASESITLLSGHKKTRRGLVYRLVLHLSGILHRLLSPPTVSDALDALDNSFAAVATYNDSGNTGGEGGLVDKSAVETVAATVGGGEVLSVNSASDDSRDVE